MDGAKRTLESARMLATSFPLKGRSGADVHPGTQCASGVLNSARASANLVLHSSLVCVLH